MYQCQNDDARTLSQALNEELEALRIRIAFAELDEAELDEIEAERASAPEYSESAQARTLEVIHRNLKRRTRRQFIRRTLPRALHTVAAIVVVLSVGLVTATATVRPVRLKMIELISQIEEQYSTVSLKRNENEYVPIPSGWEGQYYPGYIPEGFKFDNVESGYNIARYTSDNDRVLEFCEFKDTAYASINVNDENVSSVRINKLDGYAKVGNNGSTIVWSNEDYYFSLYFSGPLDEARRIAESVQQIHENS